MADSVFSANGILYVDLCPTISNHILSRTISLDMGPACFWVVGSNVFKDGGLFSERLWTFVGPILEMVHWTGGGEGGGEGGGGGLPSCQTGEARCRGSLWLGIICFYWIKSPLRHCLKCHQKAWDVLLRYHIVPCPVPILLLVVLVRVLVSSFPAWGWPFYLLVCNSDVLGMFDVATFVLNSLIPALWTSTFIEDHRGMGLHIAELTFIQIWQI